MRTHITNPIAIADPELAPPQNLLERQHYARYYYRTAPMVSVHVDLETERLAKQHQLPGPRRFEDTLRRLLYMTHDLILLGEVYVYDDGNEVLILDPELVQDGKYLSRLGVLSLEPECLFHLETGHGPIVGLDGEVHVGLDGDIWDTESGQRVLGLLAA